jgi:hypothetical protein
VRRQPSPAVAAKRAGGRSRFLTIAALLAAIVILVLAFNLPPKAIDVTGVDASLAARTVRGAIHVHSSRSDGLGDKAAIAAAARSARLQFVVLTDHGDGTRAPDPPTYIDGVLCLDGVEISSDDGHYVALGASPSAYPLGGPAASVVEDVARLGGFGIAAHPSSQRRDLQWTDWEAPFDALEWLSADSEWRDEGRLALTRSVIGYLFRPAGAITRLLDRPVAALERWDQAAAGRRVLGVAGNDAHGGIGQRMEDSSARWKIRVPSYRASFGMFSTRVELDEPPSGDADRDGRAVLEALKAGRVYTEVDAIATGAVLEFTARVGDEVVRQGSVLRGVGRASFAARASLPVGTVLVAYRNGGEVARSTTSPLEFTATDAGAYRVEAQVPGAPGSPPVPWLVSNPIFRFPPRVENPPRARPVVLELEPSWRIEKGEGSEGSVTTSGTAEAEFVYRLRPGARASQFVALVTDLSNLPDFEAVAFSIRSVEPRRISVQLRFAGDEQARWRSSVYADTTPRVLTIDARQLRRADGPVARPALQRATSLLFVVDLTNARPGDSGKLEIGQVRLLR